MKSAKTKNKYLYLIIVVLTGVILILAINSALLKSKYRQQSIQRLEASQKPAKDNKLPVADSQLDDDGDRLGELNRKLKTLGYLAGDRLAPPRKNVTIYHPETAFQGLNLYTTSGANVAILIDMRGKEVHRWNLAPLFRKPERKVDKTPERRSEVIGLEAVHLFTNGDLLAIGDGDLLKVDRNAELIWRFSGRAHHDFHVGNDGKIYVLTNAYQDDLRGDNGEKVIEDYVAVLSPDGKEIDKLSLLEALENSPYFPLLIQRDDREPDDREPGDPLHSNSIEVLDERWSEKSAIFKPGNILVSFCNLNAVCIFDPEKKEIIWAMTALWSQQHSAKGLGNGRLLVFNNFRRDGESSVIEVDPFSQQVFWEYQGSAKQPLFSKNRGYCSRLPNGNTLITESNSGRVIEVTPDKTVVWEFLNPHRVGEKDELIANVYQMKRVSFVLDIL